MNIVYAQDETSDHEISEDEFPEVNLESYHRSTTGTPNDVCMYVCMYVCM